MVQGLQHESPAGARLLAAACNRDSRTSAAFSPDGHHITCGSEDGWAFLWDAVPGDDPEGGVVKLN